MQRWVVWLFVSNRRPYLSLWLGFKSGNCRTLAGFKLGNCRTLQTVGHVGTVGQSPKISGGGGGGGAIIPRAVHESFSIRICVTINLWHCSICVALSSTTCLRDHSFGPTWKPFLGFQVQGTLDSERLQQVNRSSQPIIIPCQCLPGQSRAICKDQSDQNAGAWQTEASEYAN